MATYDYDFINMYMASRNPSQVHCSDVGLARFYARYLIQKAISAFEFRNLPENWSKSYFLYTLFCRGFVAVINTDRWGIIPQECGLSGYNIYYQPRIAVIANPLLQGGELKTPVIHEQCEIIRLQPDYGNIMDIVSTYADLMALCLQTAGISMLNSKVAYVFRAENKAAAETFKKAYDKIASGEPMIVLDKALYNPETQAPTWEMFNQNVGQNYIADRLLDDMKKIEDRFNTDIGIPNANTEKRERLISDEVNANNVDVQSKIMLWLDTMKDDIKLVNNMFNLNIEVDYRFKEMQKEAMPDGQRSDLIGSSAA